jgi:hypothetical protein
MDADEFEEPAFCGVYEPVPALPKALRLFTWLEVAVGALLAAVGVVLQTSSRPDLQAILLGLPEESVRTSIAGLAEVVGLCLCLTGLVLVGAGAMTQAQAPNRRAAQSLTVAALLMTAWIALQVRSL